MAKRRKRKRRGPGPAPRQQPKPSAVAADDAQGASAPRRGSPDGPPPAPWGSFPLSELMVLVALVMLVVAFFTGPPQATVLFVTGLALGSLAGVELSAREHFAGYKSHTTLLAGAAGVPTAVLLWALTDLSPAVSLAAGAVVAGVAAYLLGRAFRRRSGGALFKIKA
jgi:hypothetical protein